MLDDRCLLPCRACALHNRHAEAVAEARNMTLGGDAQAPEVLALRSQALYLCGAWQPSWCMFSCCVLLCLLQTAVAGMTWHPALAAVQHSFQLPEPCGCHLTLPLLTTYRQHADGAAAVSAGAQVRRRPSRVAAPVEG